MRKRKNEQQSSMWQIISLLGGLAVIAILANLMLNFASLPFGWRVLSIVLAVILLLALIRPRRRQ